jgi:hypothetical protein
MFNFLPKDDKFFDQLDTIARLVVASTEKLSALIQTFPQIKTQLAEIEEARQNPTTSRANHFPSSTTPSSLRSTAKTSFRSSPECT